jgi:hypothetical protein
MLPKKEETDRKYTQKQATHPNAHFLKKQRERARPPLAPEKIESNATAARAGG